MKQFHTLATVLLLVFPKLGLTQPVPATEGGIVTQFPVQESDGLAR